MSNLILLAYARFTADVQVSKFFTRNQVEISTESCVTQTLCYKSYELELKHSDGVLFLIENSHSAGACMSLVADTMAVLCYSYEISCSKLIII